MLRVPLARHDSDERDELPGRAQVAPNPGLYLSLVLSTAIEKETA